MCRTDDAANGGRVHAPENIWGKLFGHAVLEPVKKDLLQSANPSEDDMKG